MVVIAILTTILEFLVNLIVWLFKAVLGTLKVTAKTLEKIIVKATKVSAKTVVKLGTKSGKTALAETKKLLRRGAKSVEDTVEEFAPQEVKFLGRTIHITSVATAKALLFLVKVAVAFINLLLTFCRAVQLAIAAFGVASIIIASMIVIVVTSAFSSAILFNDGAKVTEKVSISSSTEESTGVSPGGAGWSTKGRTSVPHYVQWYANTDEELRFRDECMKKHETGEGDWANLPFNGGNVAGNACGACAFSNAISGQLQKEITPDIVVTFLNGKGINTVSGGGAKAAADALAIEYPDVAFMDIDGNAPRASCWNSGELSHRPTSRTEAVDMDKIDSWLDKGACIVMSIGCNTSWGGRNTSGHFICCYGRDSDGYYVTDSRFFSTFSDGGVLTTYNLDEAYEWEQVFTGGVQGPIVVINKSKLN